MTQWNAASLPSEALSLSLMAKPVSLADLLRSNTTVNCEQATLTPVRGAAPGWRALLLPSLSHILTSNLHPRPSPSVPQMHFSTQPADTSSLLPAPDIRPLSFHLLFLTHVLQWREELASAFWGRLQGEVSERWCQAKRREGCAGKTIEPLSRLETLRSRETEEGKEGRKKKT